MRIAALTYVYNETYNLKLWRKYYGKNLGDRNLYIIDRESDDGSTTDLGEANKILVPRIEFDDVKKSATLSSMHTALLQSFDYVIVTDCDELVVPDPDHYENLVDYIVKKEPKVASCIGLNVRHVLTKEGPLDIERPVLAQRRIANFARASSKPLVSSIPTVWVAGGHTCDAQPQFDKDLFVFHLKYMDYSLAMGRQRINMDTAWSERQTGSGHGAHHRHDYERFVSEGFLDPINAVRSNLIQPFEFNSEIQALTEAVTERNGFFHLGAAAPKYVEIPERFRNIL